VSEVSVLRKGPGYRLAWVASWWPTALAPDARDGHQRLRRRPTRHVSGGAPDRPGPGRATRTCFARHRRGARAATPWGLFRFWWTAIKLGITVALTGVVLLVLVPRLGAAAELATGRAPQTFTAAERGPHMLAPALGSALLSVNVALAIYKSRWRLRGTSPDVRRTRAEFA
jgi:hypothetical protein